MNQKKELNKRSFSFGINSAFIALVVLALVGVMNFLSSQYPQKWDATKNKLHTFSDQSTKVMKGLKGPLEATFFGDMGSKEKYRPIFESYKKLSNQFKFELVDPSKEPTRAKTAAIKKMDTLVLSYQGKTSRVEEITEEKITNEIIKLTKDTKLVICTIIGHGENSFTAPTGEGYAAAKKGLEDQAYTVREITLPQEAKIPEDCTTVVMMGANKAIFPHDLKAISEYLDHGGRMVIGVEAVVTQTDQTKELQGLLKDWGVIVKSALVIDPSSRIQQMDASVPLIAQFNAESPITKDFKQLCVMPFTRPLEVASQMPEGMKGMWIARTTPKAWGETNLPSILKGQVQFNPESDVAGPITAAVAVSGKHKGGTDTRETRLVVFGSSQFANNQYSRFGANLDLFLNAVSWTIEDESMISIRAKEDENGKVELSQNQGMIIFWLSVIIIPLFIGILGIVIWVRRKKL